MTRNPLPTAPAGDYLLHPKRGRVYDAQVSARDNGPSPRPSTAMPLRGGSPPRPEALPSPLSETQRGEVEERLNKLPIIARLGGRFDLTSSPPAVCVCIDEVMDYHLGGLGVTAVNGAAISAITDCAVGAAGIVYFPGVRSGTVNLTMSFVRPLFGKTIRAYCWAVRRTNLLLFVEAAILDSSDRVCSTASGMVAQVLARGSAATSGPGDGGDGAGMPASASDTGKE